MRFPYPATNIQDRILRKPSFRTARRSRPKSCGVEFKTAYPLLLRKQLIRADIQVALFLRIYLDDSGTKTGRSRFRETQSIRRIYKK